MNATTPSVLSKPLAPNIVSPDMLRRFDVSGPRYTSYPTADRFVEAFGSDDYVRALSQRREGAAAIATWDAC